MTAQWENSFISQTYTDTTGGTILQIDLSNFYEWEIRIVQPPPLGALGTIQVWFKDPAQFGANENTFTLALSDPTMLSWTEGSEILSSSGSKYCTNQATVWLAGDQPVQFIVWGTRRQ
tara:strand:- start:781 stop:1134 length:354 start_codon:yes stop_codon:yes gene_type:complete